MPLGHEVDEQTIRATIQAMDSTDAQCDAARSAVDSTSSYLDANWHGEAKHTYTTSIHQWLDGLTQVQQGLLDLNAAMGEYYQSTARLEQDNTTLATWT